MLTKHKALFQKLAHYLPERAMQVSICNFANPALEIGFLELKQRCHAYLPASVVDEFGAQVIDGISTSASSPFQRQLISLQANTRSIIHSNKPGSHLKLGESFRFKSIQPTDVLSLYRNIGWLNLDLNCIHIDDRSIELINQQRPIMTLWHADELNVESLIDYRIVSEQGEPITADGTTEPLMVAIPSEQLALFRAHTPSEHFEPTARGYRALSAQAPDGYELMSVVTPDLLPSYNLDINFKPIFAHEPGIIFLSAIQQDRLFIELGCSSGCSTTFSVLIDGDLAPSVTTEDNRQLFVINERVNNWLSVQIITESDEITPDEILIYRTKQVRQ